MRKWFVRIAMVVTGLFAFVLLAAAVVFALFTGPRQLEQYPEPGSSAYLLPWPAGDTFLCIQGNRAVVSHRGREEFAYDFVMPVGSDVCAARAGVVSRVVQEHDGNGTGWPNNLVSVDHGDGTSGHYLHLKRNGALVEVGGAVAQGQVIAHSGNVGNSMLPHLHFHVTKTETRETLPVSFRDVPTDGGIPRMFKSYRSGNLGVVPSESAAS